MRWKSQGENTEDECRMGMDQVFKLVKRANHEKSNASEKIQNDTRKKTVGEDRDNSKTDNEHFGHDPQFRIGHSTLPLGDDRRDVATLELAFEPRIDQQWTYCALE
jgi:hypothetical protein